MTYIPYAAVIFYHYYSSVCWKLNYELVFREGTRLRNTGLEQSSNSFFKLTPNIIANLLKKGAFLLVDKRKINYIS